MNKLSLIQRITKVKSSDVIHTSGYARAQNGDNIGAGSTQSFAERQAIEDRRQYIRSYRDSQLAANPYNRRIVRGDAGVTSANSNASVDSVNCNNINSGKSQATDRAVAPEMPIRRHLAADKGGSEDLRSGGYGSNRDGAGSARATYGSDKGGAGSARTAYGSGRSEGSAGSAGVNSARRGGGVARPSTSSGVATRLAPNIKPGIKPSF